MSTLTTLVHQITDLAIAISQTRCAIVHVQFRSAANLLCVEVFKTLDSPPTLQETIELYEPGDAEFTKRRVERRLQEMITTLHSVHQRGITPPPQAA